MSSLSYTYHIAASRKEKRSGNFQSSPLAHMRPCLVACIYIFVPQRKWRWSKGSQTFCNICKFPSPSSVCSLIQSLPNTTDRVKKTPTKIEDNASMSSIACVMLLFFASVKRPSYQFRVTKIQLYTNYTRAAPSLPDEISTPNAMITIVASP